MSIFGFFCKGKKAPEPETKFTADKAKYQWDSAAEEYCGQTGKSLDELTDDDHDVIWEYAGNHIAFFLTWIIENGFIGELHDDNAEDTAAVRNRTMTGAEFLINNCDCVITTDDLCDEILGFADSYYEGAYLDDYTEYMKKIGRRVLGTKFAWEDYDGFKKIIDKAYEEYKKACGI